jgi:hypothetical protein
MPVAMATAETDGRLIERVGRGDRDAFDQLYRRFARPVLAMALRQLGDNGRAEDAAQETFAAVWVQITNLDIGTAYTNFSGFNYTAGANWYITSDVPGPDELAAIQFDYSAASGTKSFFTNYNSDRATELVNEAGRGDDATREQAFGELQQLVMDDAVLVALFFTPARTALRNHVRDFKTVKTAWWRLEDVWLDK